MSEIVVFTFISIDNEINGSRGTTQSPEGSLALTSKSPYLKAKEFLVQTWAASTPGLM